MTTAKSIEDAAPRQVSHSMLWVGAGLAVYGIASFVYLPIVARSLGPESGGYTAITLMWTLLNAVGIGLFQPLEQEVGRRIAARASLGLAPAPAARSPLRYAAITMLVLSAMLAIGVVPISNAFFAGDDGTVIVFIGALLGMAIAYFVRGLLSGNDKFPRYGVQLALDGGLRLGGASALWLWGATSAIAFGLVLVVAPILASVLAVPRPRQLLSRVGRESAAVPETGLVALVFASLLYQLLANVGGIAIELLSSPDGGAQAAAFVSALTITRIPLFAFAAVQAVLLPALARSVALSNRSAFRRTFAAIVGLCAAVGAIGVFACWWAGPAAMQWAFGIMIDDRTIVLIAISAAVCLVAQTCAQALLAHSADLAVCLAWLIGLAVFALTLALPGAIVPKTAVALIVGTCAALIVHTIALVNADRKWRARLTDAEEVLHAER